MADLDPAAIMAAHKPQDDPDGSWCDWCAYYSEEACETYRLAEALAAERAKVASGEASDGYHTHRELYDYRMLYNAAAANEWARHGTFPVVKSWRHSDGEECFGGGWFIVVATLPTGQVSNHYREEHWPLFPVPVVNLPPEYDGHTPEQAAERLRTALTDCGSER